MNGTTLRAATAFACVAALAGPGSALAKKPAHKTAVHKKTVHKTAAQFPTVTVQVPHDYDAGGNGIGPYTVPAGVRVNLFDPVQLAAALGDQALSQLGLPSVSQTLPINLPTV